MNCPKCNRRTIPWWDYEEAEFLWECHCGYWDYDEETYGEDKCDRKSLDR